MRITHSGADLLFRDWATDEYFRRRSIADFTSREDLRQWIGEPAMMAYEDGDDLIVPEVYVDSESREMSVRIVLLTGKAYAISGCLGFLSQENDIQQLWLGDKEIELRDSTSPAELKHRIECTVRAIHPLRRVECWLPEVRVNDNVVTIRNIGGPEDSRLDAEQNPGTLTVTFVDGAQTVEWSR